MPYRELEEKLDALRTEYDLVSAQLSKVTKAMRRASLELEELAAAVQTGMPETAQTLRDLAAYLSTERYEKCLQPYNAFAAYRAASDRTRSKDMPADRQLANAALGLAGEAGEVADLVKKHLFHGVIVAGKAKDEVGDVLFYLDWVAELYGFTLQEAADANVEKLKKRYPDGFKLGGGNR
jgi:NTP pyrophosphatase (non-canonical NTP hydrolase)